LSDLIHQLSQWYLTELGSGGYWLIAALMALESTVVPIPSEVVIPPAAYLAQSQGQLSLPLVVIAATLGSWAGATLMYGLARLLGRPLLLRLGPFVGLKGAKIELSERWAARYGWAGVFLARLLPVIRHLIGIPAGLVRLDFRWYSLATLAGSAVWCSVLAALGAAVGANPELLAGSVHRLSLLVGAFAALLGGLYYLFVHRAARHDG
jgi:membrane protein DedA with SNARE-associated domain